MNLKSILLAAMLAASAGGAMAEDINQTVAMSTVGPGSYTAGFSAVHNVGGLFTDTFTFNPSVGPSLSNAIIQSISLMGTADLNFTSASLNGNALTLMPSGVNEYGFLNPVSVSGVLTLTVMGNTLTPSASYSGDINVVAAVPEPATYGMLLAGLGVVGFLARRRSQSGA